MPIMPTPKNAIAVLYLALAIPVLVGCNQEAVHDSQDQQSAPASARNEPFDDLASTKDKVPLVIRTDFSDDTAWMKIRSVVPEFANLQFLSDQSFAGESLSHLTERLAGDRYAKLVFIADETTFSNAESTLLVVDLSRTTVPTFRCLPIGIFVIEANVSSGNMKFDEFAEAAQADGVFRGFGG